MKNKSYEWKSSYEQYIRLPIGFLDMRLLAIWKILTNGKLYIEIPTDWLSKKGLKEIERIK